VVAHGFDITVMLLDSVVEAVDEAVFGLVVVDGADRRAEGGGDQADEGWIMTPSRCSNSLNMPRSKNFY
jgi:hypothetical protein